MLDWCPLNALKSNLMISKVEVKETSRCFLAEWLTMIMKTEQVEEAVHTNTQDQMILLLLLRQVNQQEALVLINHLRAQELDLDEVPFLVQIFVNYT